MIEAAPEDIELKRALFAQLSEVCGPEAVLATNTSSLPVTALASAAADPSRVVGMHFFNPPALMELLEVVAGTESSPDAVETARASGERMGKRVIIARDGPGFLANRCARPFGMRGAEAACRSGRRPRHDRPRRAHGRRLSHGPVRAGGPRRDRRGLRGHEVVLGAELPRAALAPEHDPGPHGAGRPVRPQGRPRLLRLLGRRSPPGRPGAARGGRRRPAWSWSRARVGSPRTCATRPPTRATRCSTSSRSTATRPTS